MAVLNLPWVILLLYAVTVHKTVRCNPCTVKDDDSLESNDCKNLNKTVEVSCKNYVMFTARNSCEIHDYGIIRTVHNFRNYIVSVEEPRAEDLLLVDVDKFIGLIIKNGKLITIPEQIRRMDLLESIIITGTKITTLNMRTFFWMRFLQRIDLSNNEISVIIADTGLKNNVVDISMSFNKIQVLPDKFLEQYSNLRHLNMSHNMVTNITTLTFAGLNHLESLDLSYNRIQNIQDNTFTSMRLKQLRLQYNNLTGLIDTGIFNGLGVIDLNLSCNNISSIDSYAFASMTSLKSLNLSHNSIVNIDRLAFSSVSKLEVLDLSQNQLTLLDFESSDVLGTSRQIYDLNLSSNRNLRVNGSPAYPIIKLSLQNVKTEFTFKNYAPLISELELQSCGITDMNELYIFNVQNLTYLNVSMNEITVVDKDSFRNSSKLLSLDLSLNKIRYIQPGSFYHLKKLTLLNLHGNLLSSIQFGVFQKQQVIEDLNLSNNKLHTYFDILLLPQIVKLSLDNNDINNLDVFGLLQTSISELILGDKIMCKTFATLQSSYLTKLKSLLPAASMNYYTENFDGIPCTSVPFDESSSVTNVTAN